MRRIVAMILGLALVLPICPVSASGASPKARRAHISGREYVSLGDWGRANEFVIHWLRRDKILQLRNRKTELVFTMNSREMEIDGVQVWLSFPLVYQRGHAYISQPDLEETLAPVLSPPHNSPGVRVRTVCIDPGHGGKDPGTHAGRREEKTYTLLLAKEVQRELEKSGIKVVLTRTRDVYVTLSERTDFARRHHADLFVSLHFNSTDADRNRVSGIGTFCITPAGAHSTNAGGKGNTRWVRGNAHDDKSMLLAYRVQKSLTDDLHCDDRGVRRARYQVLREARMPAILIEGGFLSNPTEGRRIAEPSYRRRMARAIAQGILAYQRIVKK